MVNEGYLATHKLAVPTTMLGVFTLSDLVLKNHDSYIEAGVTPTFVPPTDWKDEDLAELQYAPFVPAVKNDPYNDPDIFEECEAVSNLPPVDPDSWAPLFDPTDFNEANQPLTTE